MQVKAAVGGCSGLRDNHWDKGILPFEPNYFLGYPYSLLGFFLG
jgi:hypothetical protein